MKKKIFLLMVLLLILGGLIYYIYNEKTVNQTKIIETTSTELSGTITESSMNEITIKSNRGIIYSFSTIDVDTSKINGIVIGKKVYIDFDGTLDSKLDIQKGKILKIYSLEEEKTEDTTNNEKTTNKTNTSNQTDTKQTNKKYPSAWNDNGVFSKYYQKAYNKLKSMTQGQKIGQLLLVRVPENNKVSAVEKYNLGGYILFGRDTQNKTKSSLTNDINKFQKASKVPMIIATDEEGGIVVRISNNRNLSSYTFKSSQQLYKEGGYNLIKKDTRNKSNLLNSLGINTNLAPVSDVSTNKNDYIYERTFGKSAKATSKYVKTVISASKGYNVSYVLKHFPGYGNNKNTHTGSATDKRSYKTFQTSDFLPFEAGIKEGAETILVSHNVVTSMDKSNPASLSKKVHNILRDDLNFTGIIMTDDLEMDAIKDYEKNPAVKAILAGNDLLIVTDYKESYYEIKNAIKNGTITEDLLEQLVFKVLAWKYYKGLL